MTEPMPLAGVGVLVTRPAAQAAGLCDAIRSAGGEPILFPVIEIREPADTMALDDLIGRLDRFHLALFISPNAVNHALPRIRSRWPTWPLGLQVGAVGKGSARALREQGMVVDLCPEGRADSESLLALPELQDVAGKRVVIFRGEGGRELLAETLRARGAEVVYGEIYRRVRPEVDPVPLLARWDSIQVVVVTSNEGLENLVQILGETGREFLLDTDLVVVSARGEERARELGFRGAVRMATGAGDAALLEALVAWHALEKTQRKGAKTQRRKDD